MALVTGTSSNDVIDRRGMSPGPGASGDNIQAKEGNDVVWGGSGNDLIYGESGSDTLDGGYGSDIILGGDQNDSISGGAGNDYLFGEFGADTLSGGLGSDTLCGMQSDDVYIHYLGDGAVDHINDDMGPAGNLGNGGGTDILYFADTYGADIVWARYGNDLWITDSYDVADGTFSDGVIVDSFFSNPLNRIEYVFGGDGNGFYIGGLT